MASLMRTKIVYHALKALYAASQVGKLVFEPECAVGAAQDTRPVERSSSDKS